MVKATHRTTFCMVIATLIGTTAGAIPPQQDANKASFTEPTIVVYQVCQRVPPAVEELMRGLGGTPCETMSRYVWAPSFSGFKVIVCMRQRSERLAQCLYRAEDNTVQIIPVILRGE